jgi:hypothetical protein
MRLFEHFTTRPSLKQAARGTENEANKVSWITSKTMELPHQRTPTRPLLKQDSFFILPKLAVEAITMISHEVTHPAASRIMA